MAENSNLTLAAKIAKVAAEIGPIEKDGFNNEQRYKFIEYAAVAAQIRKKQAEVGIAIIPQINSYACQQIKTAKGRSGFHYLLDMTFTIVNTDDSSDKQEVKWFGESTDFGDKGINKAITSAVKYFAMRLYNISEKDEKEADQETPEMAEVVQGDQQPSQKTCRVDFNEVRTTVAELDSVTDLEDYWLSLGKLSDGQAKVLQGIFARRKKELQKPEAANVVE